jgi:hypothetical protein
MTVAELIELLQKQPLDLEVFTFEEDCANYLDRVCVQPRHYVGDDPKCLVNLHKRPDAKPCLLIY